jgi:hypothetical protein
MPADADTYGHADAYIRAVTERAVGRAYAAARLQWPRLPASAQHPPR